MHVMNIDALLDDERAYLLGLYLTDGYVGRQSKSTERFELGLAGDEVEIACRVAGVLRRCGLNPHVYLLRSGRFIVVHASGANLSSFFPSKAEVESSRGTSVFGWVSSHGLEVPFIAGLVDGDGSATVKVRFPHGSFFGKLQVQVAFAQYTFQFLVEFVYKYVNSLVTGGASLLADREALSGRGKRVCILSRGRDALLAQGVAHWSFKFARLVARLQEIEKERAASDLRSKFVTMSEAARRLELSVSTIFRWCESGKLKSMSLRNLGSKHRSAFRLVPVEEVERLKKGLDG